MLKSKSTTVKEMKYSQSKGEQPWPLSIIIGQLMSTVYMTIERSYDSSCFMPVITIDLSVDINELFEVKMCTTLTSIYRMGKGQMQICQSKEHLAVFFMDLRFPRLESFMKYLQ